MLLFFWKTKRITEKFPFLICNRSQPIQTAFKDGKTVNFIERIRVDYLAETVKR
jgi:hypothetical protein